MNWERLLMISTSLGMVVLTGMGIIGATTFIVKGMPLTVLCFYAVLILMMIGMMHRFLNDFLDAIRPGGKKNV